MQNNQKPSPMPAHQYRPFHELIRVELPDRTWPTKRITTAPRWCAVDLRDDTRRVELGQHVALLHAVVLVDEHGAHDARQLARNVDLVQRLQRAGRRDSDGEVVPGCGNAGVGDGRGVCGTRGSLPARAPGRRACQPNRRCRSSGRTPARRSGGRRGWSGQGTRGRTPRTSPRTVQRCRPTASRQTLS